VLLLLWLLVGLPSVSLPLVGLPLVGLRCARTLLILILPPFDPDPAVAPAFGGSAHRLFEKIFLQHIQILAHDVRSTTADNLSHAL